MSDMPEIRRELLGDSFSDRELDKLEKAVQRSEKLQQTLRAYNAAAEQMDDKEGFYRQKIDSLREMMEDGGDEGTPGMVSFQQMRDQTRQAPQVKTPVLRGVVTGEFDGSRVWVEPKSAPKGEYGVTVPSELRAEDLTPGTEVALDPQTFTIVDLLQKSKDPDFHPVDTGKSFQDVGGLEGVIDTLRRNVGVQLDDERKAKIQEWGLDLDKCMMLVGPPGTGKTLLVKALANEYDADMLMVNGPQLVEKFIGEGAKKIRRLYDQARSGDRPAIVFIDEIDSIAKQRQANRRHGGEEVERTMSQLLSELDGLDKETGEQNVISIFATNKPSILDPAIINRASAIEVDVPSRRAKREILQVHTRNFALADDVNFDDLVDAMPEEYTGRDIEQICKQAAISAIYRDEDVQDIHVAMSDFRNALKDLKDGNIGMDTDYLASDDKVHKEIFA